MVEQTKPYGVFTFVEDRYWERWDLKNGQELHFAAFLHFFEHTNVYAYVFQLNGNPIGGSKTFTLTANREKTKWQDLLAFANRAYAQYVDKQQ